MSGTPNYDTSVLKSDFGQGSDFGHRDYTEARKAGFTNEQIMAHLDDNPGLLINKNVPGGGGLYDEIKSNSVGRDYQEGDLNETNTAFGWQGNDNSFNKNAGYIKVEHSPKVQDAKERIQNYQENWVNTDPDDHPFYSDYEPKSKTATTTNTQAKQSTLYNKGMDDKEQAADSFLEGAKLKLTS